jgi:hypothetical protein
MAAAGADASVAGSPNSLERRGTWVYYRVVPQAMARMSAVLELPAA